MSDLSAEFFAEHEKAETLQLAAQASMQVAHQLQRQADQQRRAADNLFRRLANLQKGNA